MANKFHPDNFWESLLLGWLGPPAAWLKRLWIPPITATVSVIATVIAVNFVVDDEGNRTAGAIWTIVVAGVLSALLALVDKLADAYDQKLAEKELAFSEDLAEAKVSDLNTFLAACGQTSTRKGGAVRRNYADSLKQFLVIAAGKSLGGSRASYYTLSYDADGYRILGDPEHYLEGRSDQSQRPFLERQDPDLTIWTLLDRADTEPQIVEYPENPDGLDWNKVVYRAYYSVPVKHGDQVFGMLSVNTLEVGSISGSQRAAILAMARAYALTLSLVDPPGPNGAKRASGNASAREANVTTRQTTREGEYE